MKPFDVIVVGLGAMGSAACRELARRGKRVLGLDRFGIPNTCGSSGGDTRAIRRCYYEHSDYVPLLERAYERWAALERDSGRTLLYRTGGLYTGRADSAFITSTLQAANHHHLAHECLTRGDIRARFPQFDVPDDHIAVWEPDAGFLSCDGAIAACAQDALVHGAELHGVEPVHDWEATPAGVSVTTARATYHAEQLILTAGPWTSVLLTDLGVPLHLTRHVLGWVWPKVPARFSLGTFPIFGIQDDDVSLVYGFPMGVGRPGFKIARHLAGAPIACADEACRSPDGKDEASLHAALSAYLPDGIGPMLSMHVCLYTNTPDQHFVLDRHPRHEQVLVACGFSGHGFKFASVIGEVLADLAISRATSHPVEFLRLSRFAAQA